MCITSKASDYNLLNLAYTSPLSPRPYYIFNISILMVHKHLQVNIPTCNNDIFPKTESSLSAVLSPTRGNPIWM